MRRDRLAYFLIPLAALLAILPLNLNGCSCGHDFDFHLINWMEAARQFTHGQLHPHWAYSAAWNAGEPRFVFYPPASWTLGAILGLILPWAATPIVYTWLALTLSGVTMHRLARDFAPAAPSLLASVFYTINPYMLFTAYERTAYAELLAAAWIPLLLHAILRRRITIPGVAIPVALLWITNAPAAVMSCYALALLAVLRLAPKGDRGLDSKRGDSPRLPVQSARRKAGNTLAGATLGLGLAAFYILPAAYERRYVQIAMALIPGMRIQDNFLFHHTGDVPHDEVLHSASLIAVALIAATLLALIFLLKTSTRSFAAPVRNEEPSLQPGGTRGNSHLPIRSLLLPLTTLTFAVTVLLTPISAPVWRHLPEVAFLQFPWRLTAILAAVLSLAIAAALLRFRPKPAITSAVAICLAAALVLPAYYAFHQTCDPEDTVSSRLARFRSDQGSEPTDEYTPAPADNDSLAQSNPGYWLSADPDAKAPANSPPGPAPTQLTLNSPVQQALILNLRDYPSWRITRNGTPIARNESPEREDGLLTLPIPAGRSDISVTYARTYDQTLGDVISFASLALLFLLLRRRDLF